MSNEMGRWIERELKRRGWNQLKLAEMAGISQSQISRIISKAPAHPNETICGEKTAQALANAFGVSPVYMLRLARILKAPVRSRNFSTWLVGELLLREWEQEELARRAGLEPEVVAELTKGIPPSIEIVQKLAAGLEMDPLYIQERAGLLSSEGTEESFLNDKEIELLNEYRALPPAGQAMLSEIIQTLNRNLNTLPD